MEPGLTINSIAKERLLSFDTGSLFLDPLNNFPRQAKTASVYSIDHARVTAARYAPATLIHPRENDFTASAPLSSFPGRIPAASAFIDLWVDGVPRNAWHFVLLSVSTLPVELGEPDSYGTHNYESYC